MTQVKNGDKVKVNYKGTLEDGTLFDTSEGREPLEFTVGKGMVIKGFDEAMPGMAIGDKKTVNIDVENAYGHPKDDMVLEFPKTDFPEDMNPEPGMQLHLSDDQGNNFPVIVKEIKDEVVILDANHVLAGKHLTFDIELLSIEA